MAKGKAILKCDRLQVYSANYDTKILKAGQFGNVVENNSKDEKVFYVTLEGIVYSAKIKDEQFEYIEQNSNKLDIIKKYQVKPTKKDELYHTVLALDCKFNFGIEVDEENIKQLYAKSIHLICVNEYFKSEKLPIPINSLDSILLIEEWYKNEDIEQEEELLLKILQNLLGGCISDGIDINTLFN